MSTEDWIERIDQVVEQIFVTMLPYPFLAVEYTVPSARKISATIEFSGLLNGLCIVELSPASADSLADALLGSEGDWDDEMLDDAAGELCNMIAGGWKSRLPDPASRCFVSAPMVCRVANRYTLDDLEVRTRRLYEFGRSSFEVVLLLEEIGP